MKYAAYEFSGINPHSAGGTERDHLEALRKMGAPVPEQEKIELPSAVAYLMQAYKQIRFSRIPKDNGYLLSPRDVLKYSDIEAYNNLSGLNLKPWECDAIMSIDGIFESSRGG